MSAEDPGLSASTSSRIRDTATDTSRPSTSATRSATEGLPSGGRKAESIRRAPAVPGFKGLTYQQLLETDTGKVPPELKEQSSAELGAVTVPRERYLTQEFHDLEMERVWKRVWQMACRLEDIPEVGDHVLYEIGDLSFLVLRCSPTEVRAYPNSCLHRGRQLRDHGGRIEEIRCPFHGWTWNLDGTLKTIPAHWDFPAATRESTCLPRAQVGTWGGFVFLNPDPEAEPLEDFLGDLGRHFERWPLEDRYTEAHVSKLFRCNWKVAQEAFMEAYHVVATHPQLMKGLGDSNSQYDVFANYSRAISPNGTPSPHLEEEPSQEEILRSMAIAMDDDPLPMRVSEGVTARRAWAQLMRMNYRGTVPGIADVCDAEMCDAIYFSVFPNFHPWGALARICYRFRPNGNDPGSCLMEVILLAPFRGKRPTPAAVTHLDFDEPWRNARELGPLIPIFEQDSFNLEKVQRGLRASAQPFVRFGLYQEAKIRHFHTLLEARLGDGAA